MIIGTRWPLVSAAMMSRSGPPAWNQRSSVGAMGLGAFVGGSETHAMEADDSSADYPNRSRLSPAAVRATP